MAASDNSGAHGGAEGAAEAARLAGMERPAPQDKAGHAGFPVRLTPEHYDTRGVLLLLDSERAQLRDSLPPGVSLRLLEEEPVAKQPSSARSAVSAATVRPVERPPSQAPSRTSRATKRSAGTAVPKPTMAAPPAPVPVLRRSAREHRKVPASWQFFVDVKEQRPPGKRLMRKEDKARDSDFEEVVFESSAAKEPRKGRMRSEDERLPARQKEKLRESKRQRGGKPPAVEKDLHPAGAALQASHQPDLSCSHQMVSQQEKEVLQGKLDQLDNDQLDRVIDFLKLDMGDDTSDGQEIQLDLDTLPPARRAALTKFVDNEIKKAAAGKSKGAANEPMPQNSPAFPTISFEAGATPLAAATPALTPRRDLDSGAASAAKRQLAWEVCSAREVQRQSHLREVREAASVGGTPQSMTPQSMAPAAAEPVAVGVPAMPELHLPPAAAEGTTASAAPAPPPAVTEPAADTTSATVATAAVAPPAKEEEVQPPAVMPARPAPVEPPPRRPTISAGDSMLDDTAEVLNMVDFGWM